MRSKRVRPVEMYVCFDDHTWQEGHDVEIPEDTPAEDIERVALEVARLEFVDDDAVMFYGVYSIPIDWADWPQPDDDGDNES